MVDYYMAPREDLSYGLVDGVFALHCSYNNYKKMGAPQNVFLNEY